MRSFFTVLCYMIVLGASAQNAFFVDKKGNKKIIRDTGIDFIMIDKRVSYREVGKTWEKYITFKDLDYVAQDSVIFKTFRLDDSKNDRGFFIRAESEDKKLISMVITTFTSTGKSGGYETTYCEIIVVDNANKVLESLKFTSRKADADERQKAAPLVKKYFSDCPELMKRLAKYNQSDKENPEIIYFFSNPVDVKCQ